MVALFANLLELLLVRSSWQTHNKIYKKTLENNDEMNFLADFVSLDTFFRENITSYLILAQVRK